MKGTPAPAIIEGVSPFLTPGTRSSWGSGAEWVAVFNQLHARRISAARYRAEEAHLEELARHPDFIAAQPLEDLEAMRAIVWKHYRPTQGARAGTSYERIVNEINNQIAAHRRAAVLIVAADGDGKPTRILRHIAGNGEILL